MVLNGLEFGPAQFLVGIRFTSNRAVEESIDRLPEVYGQRLSEFLKV